VIVPFNWNDVNAILMKASKPNIAGPKRHFYNKSLERALNIPCSFDFDRPDHTLAELSQLQRLPKSTTHRLVSTLLDYDFLQYEPESQRYSLGLRVLGLGAVADNSVLLKRLVAPFLTDLHAKLDKTVAPAVLRGDEILYVDKRENWRTP
jgi:IclR family KDG regulon transcriptional repressor